MNECIKYPRPQSSPAGTCCCKDDVCIRFGACICVVDLEIRGDSNNNSDNYCRANGHWNLPAAKDPRVNQRNSSIDGGNDNFRCKEFEVY